MREAFEGWRIVATGHLAAVEGGEALDLLDASAIRTSIARADPEIVVLAAAEPWVEKCEREPAATRAINVDAASVVAEQAAALDALLVVFSSDYVFDGTKGRYVEADEVSPLNEYGRQKVDLERIAAATPRHLVCRTSGVFGWEPVRKNFVCQLLDRLRVGRELVVPSDQTITPTHAPDLARALRALVEKGATGTFHLVGPEILERLAFGRLVCEVFGLDERLLVPRPTSDMGLAAARPRAAGLADAKLRSILGRPLPPLRDALIAMRERDPHLRGQP